MVFSRFTKSLLEGRKRVRDKNISNLESVLSEKQHIPSHTTVKVKKNVSNKLARRTRGSVVKDGKGSSLSFY